MDNENLHFLEELLYNADKNEVIKQLSEINDKLILHYFAANYNWNSGFDIPNAILENTNCDFGTGLLMFHYADGFRLLETPDEVRNSRLDEWKNFLLYLYDKLLSSNFKTQEITYHPGLTKIQTFKLKKRNPNVPDKLLNESPGNVVDIPQI